MSASPQWVFGAFRLDPQNGSLWQGDTLITLRPKPLAVLVHLVEHAGQVVTKDDLLDVVWPDTAVTEGVLKDCVGQVRKALGDTAQDARFITTVHRRGYQFIASVNTPEEPGPEEPGKYATLPAASPPDAFVLERESVLEPLQARLAEALQGTRRIILITGEAGLGKTTVVNTFLGHLATRRIRAGRGQCIEQYGAGEAYLPVLEALGRLCRGEGGDAIRASLMRYAPTWMTHMPWLLADDELERLHRYGTGASQARMLRELSEALDAITAEQGLVLALEDLHWSDPSTLALLTALARRPEPARLLIIGTYRPSEARQQGHVFTNLQPELFLQGLLIEYPLRVLSKAAIADYLAMRLPGAVDLPDLVQLLHHRTSGHPLFISRMVDEWLARDWLEQQDGTWRLQTAWPSTGAISVPEGLRQLIERQLERLSPADQQLLAVASVAGVGFTTAMVTDRDEGENALLAAESRYADLARQSPFLQAQGEQSWPDGTITSAYTFAHAIYHDVIYSRIPAGQRVRWHQRMATSLELGYAERLGDVATQLAQHYEQGQDLPQAVHYYQLSAQQSLSRGGYQEASQHLSNALAKLRDLPESREHTAQELELSLNLGIALQATKGYAASEIEQAYTRALACCESIGDVSQRLQVVLGLRTFYHVRGDIQKSRQYAEEAVAMAQHEPDPARRAHAHFVLAHTLYTLGDFELARRQCEQSLACVNPQQHGDYAFGAGQVPGVFTLATLGWILWYLGYPDQALQQSQQAVALAQNIAHPPSVEHALSSAAMLHQLRREPEEAARQAAAALAVAQEQGFAFRQSMGMILQGWAWVKTGEPTAGLRQLAQGIHDYHAAGAKAWGHYWHALQAEAYCHTGQTAAGLKSVAEAETSSQDCGGQYYLAECNRIQGELLLQQIPSDTVRAEACFQQARQHANQQQALSLELRATLSLARLWTSQGKTQMAQQHLGDVYRKFTEGFDTPDLQDARVLLGELESSC